MSKEKAGRRNLPFVIAIVVLVIIVFSQSFNGDFVYDDKRQILRNPLIQNPDLYSRAVMSDVWAFKGDGTIAASNYWRPTFTAWSILNYRLFGADPFGWHLLNVLLHLAVCLLVFLVLQRMGADGLLSFVITLLFAVHPVHVESVTWIAGSPDLLFAFFFVLSLWFAFRYVETGTKADIWASIAIFLPALGAKEVALLSIPVFLLVFQKSENRRDSNRHWEITAFLAAGAAFFVVRWIILGKLFLEAPGASKTASIFWTAPSLFLFYIKQTVVPLSLGPNYPIRPEEGFSITFAASFLLSAALVYGLYVLARRSRLQMYGLGVFLLPLLPAFAVNSFIPEQIAHDRYLYLPLLGFLMIVVPEIRHLFQKATAAHASRLFLILMGIVALLFSYQSFVYSAIWLDDLSLWRHSILIDSGSSFNFSQLGSVLEENGKTDESIKAYDKALEINPLPLSYLGRARNLISKQSFDAAISDLKIVAEMPVEKINAYTLYQTYEALALAYNGKGESEEAVAVLKTARQRLPIYYAAITAKLAIVLYQKDLKDEALRELAGARRQAAVEMLPESKGVTFRLGMLYAEMGQKEKAGAALEEFLRLTAAFSDKQTLIFRKEAIETLRQLR